MWHWSPSTGPKGPIVAKAYTDRTFTLGFHLVQKNYNKVSESVKFNVMFSSLSQLEEVNLSIALELYFSKRTQFRIAKSISKCSPGYTGTCVEISTMHQHYAQRFWHPSYRLLERTSAEKQEKDENAKRERENSLVTESERKSGTKSHFCYRLYTLQRSNHSFPGL